MMKFGLCMKRALARRDLTPGHEETGNAKEDAANFIMFFDAAKQWPFPKLAAHAFEMATLALFIGLRAGLSPQRSRGAFAQDTKSEMQRDLRKQDLERKNPGFGTPRMLALKTACREKERAGAWTNADRGVCFGTTGRERRRQYYAAKKPPRPSFTGLTGDLADELIKQAIKEKIEVPQRTTVVAHLSAVLNWGGNLLPQRRARLVGS